MGRVAIAAQGFTTNDVVLAEAPTFVCNTDFRGFLRDFSSISEEAKASVLGMFHPPLKDRNGQPTKEATRLRAQSEWIYKEFKSQSRGDQPSITPELTLKLVSIFNANGPSFRGGSLEQEGTITTAGLFDALGSSTSFEKSAMFAFGSKIEHSCAPNLRYSSGKGFLEYTAIKPVSEGDHLSISYVKDVFTKPRLERRDSLQTLRSFTCECSRCVGIDECRPLWCPSCSQGVIFDLGSGKNWECQACGKTNQQPSQEILSSEKNLVRRRATLEANLRITSVRPGLLRELLLEQSEAKEELPSLHWFHYKWYNTIATAAASEARTMAQLVQLGLPRVTEMKSLLRLSSVSQMKQIAWSERNAKIVLTRLNLQDVAALVDKKMGATSLQRSSSVNEVRQALDELCSGSNDGDAVKPHTIVDVSAHLAFHAGQDLLLAGHSNLAAK